jgi:UDP-N-acetylglucosamine--N-acetylmuramyl-(pentapeptide) pyrophosphoryl-undecaprenol N-acetylglucosamine transferase
MSRKGQGVLIMAGGTGGHIFPGLAVAERLRHVGVQVRWLGARGGMECHKVPPSGFPLDLVVISGLRGKGLMRWITMPWKLLRAVFQAFRVLGEKRPGCAVSFGGYAAGPGGLAARLRGIPLLVHEQNRVPGMTNRVLARMAEKVLQAFPETWEVGRNPVTCGNPVRKSVVELEPPERRMAVRQGPIRILLTGGSQGALRLNRLLPEAIAEMAGQREITVRHQAGQRWSAETAEAYRDAGVQAQVTDFIDDMAEAYGWADLVVCRAGALTVSEVAAAGVAALFVPFPHAVDDHQTQNAEYLVENQAAELLQEANLTGPLLARKLLEMTADREALVAMAVRARSLSVPDSADRVAALCREFLS